MNNKLKVFLCCFAFLGLFCLFFIPQNVSSDKSPEEFLRIHIRANSNDQNDQQIKYMIKDEIVYFLTPILSVAKTKQQAINLINNNLGGICDVCDKFLTQNGFSYKSKASIKKEYFPTRSYGTLTLVGDVYDAIIIELGTGKGDNWWCVAYPPMCFVDDGRCEVVYKSKIVEIIENFFK